MMEVEQERQGVGDGIDDVRMDSIEGEILEIDENDGGFFIEKDDSLDGDRSAPYLWRWLGMRPSQVSDSRDAFCEVPGKLGFKVKDYGDCSNVENLEIIKGGDMTAALSYLQGMKLIDKEFVLEQSVSDDGTLRGVFWRDGMSLAEFELFGDVLMVDRTHKTSRVRFPLVIFSGINNHGSTCVFGGAIMYDETLESYRWLLKMFRNSMNGKIPGLVFTDQDPMMLHAFWEELPGAHRRFCSWSVACNAKSKFSDPDHSSHFVRLMQKRCSVEEFELSWGNFIETYGLSDNKWLAEAYENRRHWAEAYFRRDFMAFTRIIRRAESMKTLIKLSMKESLSFTAFLNHYNEALQKIRNVFFLMQEDAEKRKSVVRDFPLQNLEFQAAMLLTKDMFLMMRHEIKWDQAVIFESKQVVTEKRTEFIYSEYLKDPKCLFHVVMDLDKNIFTCDCMMFESDGLPCRHLICGVKYMRLYSLPVEYFHPRWLVKTGIGLREKYLPPFLLDNPQRTPLVKLYAEYVNLCLIACHSDGDVSEAVNGVRKAWELAQNVMIGQSKPARRIYGCDDVMRGADDVADDSQRINSPGDARVEIQKCSYCGHLGHKVDACVRKPIAARRKEKLEFRSRLDQIRIQTRAARMPLPLVEVAGDVVCVRMKQVAGNGTTDQAPQASA